MGDSISTFNGYSNDPSVNSTIGGNGPRYDVGPADTKPGSYCLLDSVDQTWWMHFANRSGMELLVNNAWAGSQVFGMTLLPENLYSMDMAAWEQHNGYIRAAAEYYGIPLVDLAKNCAITWDNYSGYMIDKIHPTKAGMALISDCIESQLQAYYKESTIPGDINGDKTVDHNDAIYLLLHTLFGEAFYPLK